MTSSGGFRCSHRFRHWRARCCTRERSDGPPPLPRDARNGSRPTAPAECLRSCVQLYQPIGYRAGLSFLEHIAGRFETDDAALLRALDALVHTRRLWHEDVRIYSEMRRAAKVRGQRAPNPATATQVTTRATALPGPLRRTVKLPG